MQEVNWKNQSQNQGKIKTFLNPKTTVRAENFTFCQSLNFKSR